MPDLDSEHECAGLNDRDLVRRFIQDADESAFAAIVQRYQRLVMSVCRRVIGHEAEAEDAFQATFIVLARRPKSIRLADSLSSWLYTVAWRTSRRLVKQRRMRAVESLEKAPSAPTDNPLDRIASAQDCMVLDEELNELPDKYRDVLVMTYFTGQSSRQIADQLGVSKGTVDGRIRQARNMLRIRLARRGVAVGVLAVAAGLSTGAAASAAPAVLESTLQLGAQTLSGTLPGTTDLSHLEPLIRPETAMMSSKLIVTGLICATVVTGIAGLQGVAQDDGSTVPAGSEVGASPDLPELDVRSTVPSPFVQNARPANGAVTVVPPPLGVERSVSTDPFASTTTVPSAGRRDSRYFKSYPADAEPIEIWLHECLDKPVRNLDFPGETPLSEILETVESFYTSSYGRDALGDKTDAQMSFLFDRGELNLEGIVSLEDVTVVDISFEGISLRNALKHIFSQTIDDTLSPVPLTYVIQDETIIVTSEAKAERMLYTRVYDVAALTALEFESGFQLSGAVNSASQSDASLLSIGQEKKGRRGKKRNQNGAEADRASGSKAGNAETAAHADSGSNSSPAERVAYSADAVSLPALVREMTSPPCAWNDHFGGGSVGAVRQAGASLIVRQTFEGHREVARLLNLIHQSVTQRD